MSKGETLKKKIKIGIANSLTSHFLLRAQCTFLVSYFSRLQMRNVRFGQKRNQTNFVGHSFCAEHPLGGYEGYIYSPFSMLHAPYPYLYLSIYPSNSFLCLLGPFEAFCCEVYLSSMFSHMFSFSVCSQPIWTYGLMLSCSSIFECYMLSLNKCMTARSLSSKWSFFSLSPCMANSRPYGQNDCPWNQWWWLERKRKTTSTVCIIDRQQNVLWISLLLLWK